MNGSTFTANKPRHSQHTLITKKRDSSSPKQLQISIKTRKRAIEPRPHPPNCLNKRYWDDVRAGLVKPMNKEKKPTPKYMANQQEQKQSRLISLNQLSGGNNCKNDRKECLLKKIRSETITDKPSVKLCDAIEKPPLNFSKIRAFEGAIRPMPLMRLPAFVIPAFGIQPQFVMPPQIPFFAQKMNRPFPPLPFGSQLMTPSYNSQIAFPINYRRDNEIEPIVQNESKK